MEAFETVSMTQRLAPEFCKVYQVISSAWTPGQTCDLGWPGAAGSGEAAEKGYYGQRAWHLCQSQTSGTNITCKPPPKVIFFSAWYTKALPGKLLVRSTVSCRPFSLLTTRHWIQMDIWCFAWPAPPNSSLRFDLQGNFFSLSHPLPDWDSSEMST